MTTESFGGEQGEEVQGYLDVKASTDQSARVETMTESLEGEQGDEVQADFEANESSDHSVIVEPPQTIPSSATNQSARVETMTESLDEEQGDEVQADFEANESTNQSVKVEPPQIIPKSASSIIETRDAVADEQPPLPNADKTIKQKVLRSFNKERTTIFAKGVSTAVSDHLNLKSLKLSKWRKAARPDEIRTEMEQPAAAAMKVDSKYSKLLIAGCVLVILCIGITAVVVPTVLLKDSSNSSSSGGAAVVGGDNVDSTANSPVSPTDTTLSFTTSPSSPPTFFVEVNLVPSDPPQGYFNYDVNDDEYGPNVWDRVDTSNHPLREFGPDGFGAWKDSLQVDPTDNRCINKGTRQSPKDLVQEDGIIIPGDGNDGVCDAQHQIRTRCGSYPITSPMYKKQILPHKLTIIMNRRACLDIEYQECKGGRPPLADYPKYSATGSDFSDLLNFDIKVPGEHTIGGETFDAEIQMLHAHLTNRKLSSLGIPIRAMEDGHNSDFQTILDEFQRVHYMDAISGCSKRNLRQDTSQHQFYDDLMAEAARNGWYNEHSAKMTDPEFVRGLQHNVSVNFNPYSESFMRDMFFFRYPGSITEPPCMFVTWWVMDKPMIVSFEQLRQIKFLLFTHVDENCKKTSVHNVEQSVARPIQPLGKPELAWIQHCETGSFEADVIPPNRRC